MAWHPEPKGQAEISRPPAALRLKVFVISSLYGLSLKSEFYILIEHKADHENTQNWQINYTASRNNLPQVLLFY
jgi:hypothetical protein